VRVLVCGGRTFGVLPFDRPEDNAEWRDLQARKKAERDLLKDKLVRLRGQGMSLLIHGGARGADSLAGQWAEFNGVPQDVYWADWNRYGKAAGILRNMRMLEDGQPDLVVGFPGGRGTADMLHRAASQGIMIERV
jgi:hypothetical protein